MAIIKPYTFVANTYAKSAEVNENFDVLYAEVNSLGSQILDYRFIINDLQSSKANINGDYSNRFAVANAVTNYDAVNKQTLFNTISNSLPYIYGLGITKVSNNTIGVAAGECYDTTETTLLKLSGNLEKQNQTQAASSSYYVYIIGGTNVTEDILISTLSLDPNLPDGYTLSRRIGSYTTDSDNKILQVNNEQVGQYTISNLINQNVAEIMDKVAPNYTAGYSISSGFTAPSAGWVYCYHYNNSDNQSLALYINGVEVFRTGDSGTWSTGHGASGFIFARSGKTVTFSGSGSNTVRFMPCVGGV